MSETTAKNGTVRERILAAALRLFVEKGFHETSIPDIVEESGTSIGAVYHHFGSKDELAHVLHRQLVDEYVRMTTEEVLSQPDARTRIHAYTSMFFHLTEEDPDFVAYLIYARPKSAVEENLTVCSREGLVMSQEIVQAGKRAGEVRDLDDSVLCATLSGTLMRLMDLRLTRVITEPLTGMIDDTAQAIWAGLRA